MISAFLCDGATDTNIERVVVPGMDRLAWRSTAMESEYTRQRPIVVASTNEAMLTRDPVTVAPWPTGLFSQQPIDNTRRYANFPLHLGAYDMFSGKTTPLNHRYISDGNYSITKDDRISVTEALNPEKIREYSEDPTDWLRLPHVNEGPSVGMGSQLNVIWNGLPSNAYRLSLDDNIFFSPFDLTELSLFPESTYGVYDDTGNKAAHIGNADLHEGGTYVIGLRPRTWRISARTRAYYYRVTPFFIQLFYVDFITTSYNRPPVYPYRHDAHHSAQSTPINDYLGTPVSYDYGIYYQFANSIAAQTLRRQISLVQSYDQCMIYVIAWVEPATLFIWAEEAAVGEICCTITRKDTYGETQTISVKQERNTSYSRTEVGVFYSDFYYWGG